MRTQSHNLFEQAGHGIRFFDMRIAASTVVVDGERFAEMRTFHSGITTEKKKTATVLGLQNAADLQVKRSKLRGGDWGEGLTGLLHQAGRFVSDPASNSEFLILKFDKSTNWVPIARQCEEELGNLLYSQSGNLNTTPIGNLAGRVIVLFPTGGIAAMSSSNRSNSVSTMPASSGRVRQAAPKRSSSPRRSGVNSRGSVRSHCGAISA